MEGGNSNSDHRLVSMENFETYGQLVQEMNATFISGKSKDISFRLKQLENLLRLYRENWDRFQDVLKKDLRKPLLEAKIVEHSFPIADVKYAIKYLKQWSPHVVPPCLGCVSDKIYNMYEPFGTVLIIAPWNAPLHLTLVPLCAAIAAGNCAVIKPSELSPHCAALVEELLPKYLDKDCFKVVSGGPEVILALLAERWDFILYTGSPAVGKIIYEKAAMSLTPVCLELGGKSAVYIHPGSDMRKTAERVIWGKCGNLGQTCISPDYILCNQQVEDQFIQECCKVIHDFYGPNPQMSKDLARIINPRHFRRLLKYLKETKGNIAVIGNHDESDLWMEPTVLVGVDSADSVMQEEIFGPILPILRIQSAEEAILFINRRRKALALYVFSEDVDVSKMFIDRTRSGSVAINDCILQCGLHDLPFGGVGDSGIGQYRGVFGFQTFSRPRSILKRSFSTFENWTAYKPRYPPYSRLHCIVFPRLVEWAYIFVVNPWRFVQNIALFALGLIVMFCIEKFSGN